MKSTAPVVHLFPYNDVRVHLGLRGRPARNIQPLHESEAGLGAVFCFSAIGARVEIPAKSGRMLVDQKGPVSAADVHQVQGKPGLVEHGLVQLLILGTENIRP